MSCRVGVPIPAELYIAVAEVLRIVFRSGPAEPITGGPFGLQSVAMRAEGLERRGCVHTAGASRLPPAIRWGSFDRPEPDRDGLARRYPAVDLFLRPDALDILRAARARDFDVKINTHGTLEYQTIFAVGLTLFVLTLIMNIVSIMVLVLYVNHIGRKLRAASLIEAVSDQVRKKLDELKQEAKRHAEEHGDRTPQVRMRVRDIGLGAVMVRARPESVGHVSSTARSRLVGEGPD